MTSITFRSTRRFPLLAGLLLLAGGCDLLGGDSRKSSTSTKIEPAQVDPSRTPASDPPDETDPEPDAGEDAAPDESEPAPAEQAAAGPPEEDHTHKTEGRPHPGPWLWVTRSSAAIYAGADKDRDAKLGYVKRGGRVPIKKAETVEGPNCPRGWYEVASGGFICSHVGTTDGTHRDVKFRPNQPNVDEILPYPYKRNAHNGTPLYRSIPSKDQTLHYEPYLPEAKKRREELEKKREADRKQLIEAGLGVGGSPNDNEDEADVPIWEREDNLHEVTLEQLRADSDDILAARMMKGFYVAVDKTFNWDDRTYYKTTKGLITPADRFWATSPSDFQGTEIDGEEITLPIGWVFGVQKSTATYDIDTDEDKREVVGSKARFEMVQLKYRYHRIGNIDYFQMKDGQWIRDRFVRMTTPNPRPEKIGPNERWIDVDISEQTLVVFEGDRPVYATLISSGKESSVKEKDHSTPRGMWRVREKHIASTMDGDGSAAGDLPYSIEDVPYIMYFHKSYATHGAFWHRNYGVQMSHGCINLAPLDAKWIFFYADPQLPEGFHGNWSSEQDPGSWVVVHD